MLGLVHPVVSFGFSSCRLAALLALALCILAVPAAAREPVRAGKVMVASSQVLASRAGVEIMRSGGNAVDAAVAVAFALAVTYPAAGNLGGGGFMLIRRRNGVSTAIDYREIAPLAASADMYLNAGAGSSLQGCRASGVPGTVAGMGMAWRRYGSGRVSWAELIEPARRLAVDGFAVSPKLAESLKEKASQLSPYEESRRIFLKGGKFYRAGDILRQEQLAATLQRLQSHGPAEFYTGETARFIAADMKAHGGLITLDDLQRYRPQERVPLQGNYRGYPIITMPPPSSGGFVLLEMLNILEDYDLGKMPPTSPEKCHLLLEAMRRAFADRASYGADPDFVPVPVAGLISKDYAATRRKSIDLLRATPSTQVGAGKPAGHESEQTTHFTVVDAEGNAVSNTYTLNGSFGSGVTIRGAGFLMNNEMDDFTTRPNAPNLFGLIQNEGNKIEPGKRPLSSMTPTFVLRPDGTLWFALGSPGGPTIINSVLQVMINVIDHDMNLQQAVDTPRIHHQWLPDHVVTEPEGLPNDVRQALEKLGHKFAAPRFMGDVEAVMIGQETGEKLGASDPRTEGQAVGY